MASWPPCWWRRDRKWRQGSPCFASSDPMTTAMFDSVLIANRGEIALRILRACRGLGLRTVAVHSEADRDAPYVRQADQALCIGPASPGLSYLNQAAILAAAKVSGAQAIHPGYGFLSENAGFVDQVERAGLTFIGPSACCIRAMSRSRCSRTVMATPSGWAAAIARCSAATRRCSRKRPRRTSISY